MIGSRSLWFPIVVLLNFGSGIASAQTDKNAPDTDPEIPVLEERAEVVDDTVENPNVFVAHRPNYLFPGSFTTSLNREAYGEFNREVSSLYQDQEVNFQISMRVQVNEESLFFPDDGLQVGLTLEAWWQLYSRIVSSPFRETNYSPEVFYRVPLDWHPFGLRPSVTVGVLHQSNGQVQGLSRSWNRIYGSLRFEGERFYASVKPWYRLPEDPRENPADAEGDDNPDILDFMGHGELSFGWRGTHLNYYTMLRGNPATGKGAAELFISFPLFKRFRGVVKYFDGYGNSLIDYDHYQQRLGVGILLSNLF